MFTPESGKRYRSEASCLSVCFYVTQSAVKPFPAHDQGWSCLPGDNLAVLASVFSEVRVGAAGSVSVRCVLWGTARTRASRHPGPFWKAEAEPSVRVTRTCRVASDVRPRVRWETQPTPSFSGCVPSVEWRERIKVAFV